MSKQSAIDFPDVESRNRSSKGRKRKGEYEVWMRHIGKPTRCFGGWHKVRGYATEDAARKSLADHERKWNDFAIRIRGEPSWEFTLRMPGEPKPSDEN